MAPKRPHIVRGCVESGVGRPGREDKRPVTRCARIGVLLELDHHRKDVNGLSGGGILRGKPESVVNGCRNLVAHALCGSERRD